LKQELSNDPNVFAGQRVGTIKASLLRRLGAAGFFSVIGSPSREIEAEGYSQMTLQQCRGHVKGVERLAAKYRRITPQTMNAAIKAGYEIVGIESHRAVHGIAMTRGIVLLRESSGLKRKFVIPFAARYSWRRPRLLKQGEGWQF